MLGRLTIIICLIAGGICAQDNMLPAFRADGSVYGHVQGKSQEPKLVIDSVRFAGDSTASLVLNSTPSQNRERTSPTSDERIILISAVQDLREDTDHAINSYVLHWQRNDSVTVRSSDADDESLVWLTFLVQ